MKQRKRRKTKDSGKGEEKAREKASGIGET